MMSWIYSRHWTISSGRHFQNGRHNTAQIQQTMLNLCSIVAAILKMSTARNFLMSGINSGHHNQCRESNRAFSKWLPQYCTNITLSDFNDISYVGRLWCSEFIPDIEQFLAVAIFKMAATIPHKFNIVQCYICAVLWQPFWKWRPLEIFQCRE
jgi:hypothetical protein